LDTPLIVVTNDDGIHSAGLWAAATALDSLGEVMVVAPESEQSGAGRSMPISSEGRIQRVAVKAAERVWEGYAVHGSPAQTVQHALLEIVPRRVDLVVSGINYGENVGTAVTISGTVGAALEAASFGIPALAVSLQATVEEILSQEPSIDFSVAAHFTREFGRRLLASELPDDVDVLKLDVPRDATPDTPWQVAHLTRHRYFTPLKPQRARLEDSTRIGFTARDGMEMEPRSDARVMAEGYVAVTPLSLDMTSRIDPKLLVAALDGK
jgi:5'-nucleotidase